MFYSTDKNIKYIFSDNETNFLESSNYCKKESAHSFLPEDFQSGALEKIAPFTQFTLENISVWTGVIERKTWNPLSCKMNIFSSNCSILTSSEIGTDTHYQGSQTTYTTESKLLLRFVLGRKVYIYIILHKNLDELIPLKNSKHRKTSRRIPSNYTLGLCFFIWDVISIM